MQFSFLSQLPFIHSGCDRGPGFAKDVVVAVNDDGDDVEGTIEWDSTSLKATRHLFFVVAAVDDVVAAVDDDAASLCRLRQSLQMLSPSLLRCICGIFIAVIYLA